MTIPGNARPHVEAVDVLADDKVSPVMLDEGLEGHVGGGGDGVVPVHAHVRALSLPLQGPDTAGSPEVGDSGTGAE